MSFMKYWEKWVNVNVFDEKLIKNMRRPMKRKMWVKITYLMDYCYVLRINFCRTEFLKSEKLLSENGVYLRSDVPRDAGKCNIENILFSMMYDVILILVIKWNLLIKIWKTFNYSKFQILYFISFIRMTINWLRNS